MKNWQKGAWPRSRATYRSHGVFNKQASEALRHCTILESIAFDFQHCYGMWTWFVKFLDEQQKLILKN